METKRRFVRNALVRAADRLLNPRILPGNGSPRVLHLHVRKSGGTSFNIALLSQLTDDPQTAYTRTAEKLLKCCNTRLGRYCAWDPALAEAGRYAFCHTHSPLWEFRVPDGVFAVSILRDPLSRLWSLHNMLNEMITTQSRHRGLAAERKTFRSGFTAFLQALPEPELLGQLYKYSPNLDMREATECAGQYLHLVGRTEDYDAFILRFNELTGYALPVLHLRQGQKNPVQYHELPSFLLKRLDRERKFVELAVKACSRGATIRAFD